MTTEQKTQFPPQQQEPPGIESEMRPRPRATDEAHRGSGKLQGKVALITSLAERGIRVNGVAPGPIWTPLIPSTFPEEKVETFGQDVPLKRAGQPEEVAPSFVFLASDDASYMAGQILHPNGGEVING